MTFAHVVNKRGAHYVWTREIGSHMIGPASLAACYAVVAAGNQVRADCRYVKEASAAFGANPSDVHRELLDFMSNGGTSMAERIVASMPRDPRVDPRLDEGYESFALAYMVLADHSLRRFCPDGRPTVKSAHETVALAEKIVANLDFETSSLPQP